MAVVLEASLGDGSDCCRAEPRGSSVGGYPVSRRSSLGRLSRIEGRLSGIKKVKPQNVIPHQAWMVRVPGTDQVSRHYTIAQYPCPGVVRSSCSLAEPYTRTEVVEGRRAFRRQKLGAEGLGSKKC